MALDRILHGNQPVRSEAQVRATRADMHLSTGRIVKHRRLGNGAWHAFATPGPEELMPAEWEEYLRRRKAISKHA